MRRWLVAELYAPASFLLVAYEPPFRAARMAPKSLRPLPSSGVPAEQLADLFATLPRADR